MLHRKFVVAGPPVSYQTRDRATLKAWQARIRDEATKRWTAPPLAGKLKLLLINFDESDKLPLDDGRPTEDNAMRNREQFMTEYAKSHRNPLNKVIHVVCVPAIFFATGGLLWCVPLGSLLGGLSAEAARFVNLATLVAIPILIFYARLGLQTFVTGLAWMLLTFAACVAIQGAGLPLLWICVAVWVTAWAGQFYGHHVEGAKPSFSDDLIFLLIGPLFVQEKLGRLVRTGSL
jgi:uncharacterized membrane protein YGL010W